MKNTLAIVAALTLAGPAVADLPDQVSYDCNGFACTVYRPDARKMRVECGPLSESISINEVANSPASIEAAKEKLDNRCRSLVAKVEAQEKNGPRLEKVLEDTYAEIVKDAP